MTSSERSPEARADERAVTVAALAPAALSALGLLWLAFGGSPLWLGTVAIYIGAGLYALYAVVAVVMAWRYR